MLQAGVLKPVQEATPWINSFVLEEGKDMSESLKLRISLDPTNLNKALMREPSCSTRNKTLNFLGETYTINGCKPAQTKVSAIIEMPPPPVRSKFSHSLA